MATSGKSPAPPFLGPLQQLQENLSSTVAQLNDKDVGRAESSSFDSDKFWAKLHQAVSVVSSEATRLSVMFLRAPLPSEKDCKALVERLESSVLVTLSAFYALPKSQGMCIWRAVRDGVLAIVEGVQMLACTLQAAKGTCTPEQLRYTGCVWEACSAIEHLPRNQCQAMVQWLKSQQRLLQDALDELTEVKEANGASETGLEDLEAALSGEVEEDCDDKETTEWNDRERLLATCSEGLVKVSKAMVKKLGLVVSAHSQTPGIVPVLDMLHTHVDQLSACVDDVVSSIPAPISEPELAGQVDALAAKLRTILECARTSPVCGEDAVSWLDFLSKAVEHNHEKFRSQSTSKS